RWEALGEFSTAAQQVRGPAGAFLTAGEKQCASPRRWLLHHQALGKRPFASASLSPRTSSDSASPTLTDFSIHDRAATSPVLGTQLLPGTKPAAGSSLPVLSSSRSAGLSSITNRKPSSSSSRRSPGSPSDSCSPADYVALLAPTEPATPRISTREDISREFP